MSGRLPEQRVERPLALMRWEAVSFVHWAYDPALVVRLVPPHLELDLFEERAWVGIVSFFMADVRLRGTPPVPRLSTFPEINVRTYVRGPDGNDGLLFLTLEASRLPMMLADPAVGIAYRWAAMRITCNGDQVEYRTRRRWPPDLAARSAHDVEVGEALAPGQLTEFDHYLTGRWRAYSHRRGQLFSTPVHHQPWPLHAARLAAIDDGLITACGLSAPAGEPVVHYAPAVHVRLGVPRRVG